MGAGVVLPLGLLLTLTVATPGVKAPTLTVVPGGDNLFIKAMAVSIKMLDPKVLGF